MVHWYEYFFDGTEPNVAGHPEYVEVVAVIEHRGSAYLVSRVGACGGPHSYYARRYPDGEWVPRRCVDWEDIVDIESAVALAAGVPREDVLPSMASECPGGDSCSQPLAPECMAD
jgi:hypothetical protein